MSYTQDQYDPSLDSFVLLPDLDALQDTIDAHNKYDPPGSPLILSSSHDLLLV